MNPLPFIFLYRNIIGVFLKMFGYNMNLIPGEGNRLVDKKCTLKNEVLHVKVAIFVNLPHESD